MDNSENYCIYTNIPYSKLKDREETIEYGQFRELLYLQIQTFVQSGSFMKDNDCTYILFYDGINLILHE